MSVVEERLATYAASLPLERIQKPAHDPVTHYLGHGRDTVAFFLTLDAINFGSGYFPHLVKRPGRSGYFTIAAALTERFATKGAFSPAELAEVTVADCLKLFKQNRDDPAVCELMNHYAAALQELGRYVVQRFAGRYESLIDEAKQSTQRLVDLLIAMPHFADVQVYRGESVPFYKRAQITCADLAIAFDNHGPGDFSDLSELTIFADNLVPHVLHCDGVLAYRDELGARIEAGDELCAGSPEEVEIRACAVHAVERMVEELAEVGHRVMPMQLDNLLWNRGQQPHYKARPRHRCRTVFY